MGRSRSSIAMAAVLVATVSCTSAAPTTGSHHHRRSASAAATSAPIADPTTPSPPVAVPSEIQPVVHPTLPGEGRWRSAAPWVQGGSPVQVAWYRPTRTNIALRATVVWIDPARSRIALYPGQQNPPPSSLPQGPTMVPVSARQNLLATFNSGFYLSTPYGAQPGSVHEGFAVNGKVYSPFVPGLATLVVTADGGVDITAWTGGASPPPTDVVARQNLPLLVNHGVATPAAARPAVWGETLGGVPAVSRTALGIDAAGHLLYVSAPSQTAASLAAIMVHLGAVRAMELDINPEWPVAITYHRPGGHAPVMLFPNYQQTPDVFLHPGMKDFFAVYLRDPGTPPGREPF